MIFLVDFTSTSVVDVWSVILYSMRTAYQSFLSHSAHSIFQSSFVGSELLDSLFSTVKTDRKNSSFSWAFRYTGGSWILERPSAMTSFFLNTCFISILYFSNWSYHLAIQPWLSSPHRTFFSTWWSVYSLTE